MAHSHSESGNHVNSDPASVYRKCERDTGTLIVQQWVWSIERSVVIATDNGFWVHNILGCVCGGWGVRVGGSERTSAIFKIIFPVWENSFDSSQYYFFSPFENFCEIPLCEKLLRKMTKKGKIQLWLIVHTDNVL